MFFEYKGAKTHYEINGAGSENVLLLHGWGGSTQSWLPLERDLSPSKRVINLDFPGFGQSDEPKTPWTVGDYTDMVSALIDELGLNKIELVAHSFGGRVALKLNYLRPDLVSRQVLTGCAGLRSQEDSSKSSAAHKLSKLYDNGLSRKILGDKGVEKLQNAVRAHFGSEDYKNASPMMREIFKNVVNEDLSYCLKNIKASTLLIFGANDTATPLWMGKKLESEISDAALIVFENCGHFAYLEQYQRFYQIVKQFLNA